jgi:hypothetical protein
MHPFGQSDDMYNYFNTPWMSIITRIFRDMVLVTNPAGTLEHTFSLGGFGPNIRNLDTTGGFTTFAEDLELGNNEVHCYISAMRHVRAATILTTVFQVHHLWGPYLIPLSMAFARMMMQCSSSTMHRPVTHHPSF